MATQEGDVEARANEHEKEDVQLESDEYFTDQTVRCVQYCAQIYLSSLFWIRF